MSSSHVTSLHDMCVGIMLLPLHTQEKRLGVLNCEVAAKLWPVHLNSVVIYTRVSVLGRSTELQAEM
jgi:hypothetical protein